MSTQLEPEFVAGTLAWCNKMRAKQGKPPLERLPKGERDDPFSCPCGNATGLYVDREHFGGSADFGTPYELPGPVIDFVRAFDAGELPQYDESPDVESPDDWDFEDDWDKVDDELEPGD